MLNHFSRRNFTEKCCLKLVILGADHLTFERGAGAKHDFEKKVSCRMISRWKKPCKEIPSRKKFQHWKKNFSWGIILEKSLALLYVGEKIISLEVCRKKFLPKPNDPHPPPPQKSNGQPLSCFFFIFCSVCLCCSHIWFERPLLLTQIFTLIASKLFMTI